MPVAHTEVERALERVPMLPLTETVVHKDFFVQRCAHDHLRIAAHFCRRQHFVHDDKRACALRLVVVGRVEHVQVVARLHHVRVDTERLDDLRHKLKLAVGFVANGNAHCLHVGVCFLVCHVGKIHPEFSLVTDYGRCPVFLAPFTVVANADVMPIESVVAFVQLHALNRRCIHVVFAVVFDYVGVALAVTAVDVQFHFLSPFRLF